MFCKNCGAEINESQKFCPECGKETEAYSRSERSGYSAAEKFGISRQGKTLLCIVLGASILIFILAMFMFLSGMISMMKHGWDGMKNEDKFTFILSLISFVIAFIFLRAASVGAGRYICIADNKINGNIGIGLSGKDFELLFNEIISVIGNEKYGTIIIESHKGTITLNYIEESEKAICLIKQHIEKNR